MLVLCLTYSLLFNRQYMFLPPKVFKESSKDVKLVLGDVTLP